jgi:hypothetical protein
VSGPACAKCGHIHCSRDVQALSRYTGVTGYRTADGEIHATREDAQQWLCKQRQRRRDAGASAPRAFAAEESALFVERPPEQPRAVAEFPAAAMETAARAKAWRDFLAEVRMSLLVWEVDEVVRSECQDVVSWMRQCCTELTALCSPSPVVTS